MTAGADAVLLEGMRIVRCDDSPINSVVAAGAASYILVSSHSALSPACCAGTVSACLTRVALLWFYSGSSQCAQGMQAEHHSRTSILALCFTERAMLLCTFSVG